MRYEIKSRIKGTPSELLIVRLGKNSKPIDMIFIPTVNANNKPVTY